MLSRLMSHPSWPLAARYAVFGQSILQAAALKSRGLASGHRRVLRAVAAETAGCRLTLLQGCKIALQASAGTWLARTPWIVARRTRRGGCDNKPDGGYQGQSHVHHHFPS
jgi:hypothetical protein